MILARADMGERQLRAQYSVLSELMRDAELAAAKNHVRAAHHPRICRIHEQAVCAAVSRFHLANAFDEGHAVMIVSG